MLMTYFPLKKIIISKIWEILAIGGNLVFILTQYYSIIQTDHHFLYRALTSKNWLLGWLFIINMLAGVQKRWPKCLLGQRGGLILATKSTKVSHFIVALIHSLAM